MSQESKVLLCKEVRRLDDGSSLACDKIWLQTWRNGIVTPRQGFGQGPIHGDTVEVYCGKEKVAKNVVPAVVVRNISKALGGQSHKRLTITDTFYYYH
ncbi:Hypothetical protein PHPALM_14090 [Phytophthora palmivora]|uniref:Uncharacterized protein n=1 Tax=Phytophthora palmivora TaxID=4796 RepID=A0A2P4XVM6_9STRA|nr:Hypothetical protein PHPALM_14090 [Phytophthora palmivora]